MDTKEKRNKIIFIILAAVFALVVIWVIVLFILDIPKTGRVKIEVAPEHAKVMIDGKNYGNGTQKIKPGKYAVSIEAEGFEKYTGDINVEEGKEAELSICLKDNGDWYETHGYDGTRCQMIEEAGAEGWTDEDPIQRVLPYHSYDDGFDIDLYEKDGKKAIRVSLLSCKKDRQAELKAAAERWMKDHNIDTEKYEISYEAAC